MLYKYACGRVKVAVTLKSKNIYKINYLKKISGLIFSLTICFLCNNHNVFAETLSLSLSGVDAGNELNFEFDKGAHESAKARDILMNVRTDNRSGYKVMISSAGTDSILRPSQSDNTGKIMPLSASKTLANFNEKEWGVSIDQTNFLAVPGSSSPMLVVNKTTASAPGIGDSSGAGIPKISVGVRAGGDLIEDTYNGNILITVITNPVLKTATFKKNSVHNTPLYSGGNNYRAPFLRCPTTTYAFQRTNQLKAGSLNEAETGSDLPIYVWNDYKGGKNYVYWYSEADIVYAPEDATLWLSRMASFKRNSANCFGEIDLDGIDFSKTEKMDSIFLQDTYALLSTSPNLKILHLENINTAKNAEAAFAYTNLRGLDMSKVTFENATSFMHTFYRATADANADFSNLKGGNATTMEKMFYMFKGPQNLSLSSLNTSTVTNMKDMFRNLAATKSIDASSFNTENVTDMNGMFMAMSYVETIDVSGFNTKNVTDMSMMFYSNSWLKTIYGPEEFDRTNLSISTNMFGNSSHLVGGANWSYSAANVDAAYARIGKPGLRGYFKAKP